MLIFKESLGINEDDPHLETCFIDISLIIIINKIARSSHLTAEILESFISYLRTKTSFFNLSLH